MGTQNYDPKLRQQKESEKLHGDPLEHAQQDKRSDSDATRRPDRELERQASEQTSIEDREDELENQPEN
jgi:hypothetical protein